jgi:hypothetical protein
VVVERSEAVTREQISGWLFTALDRYGFPTAAMIVVGLGISWSGSAVYKDILLPMVQQDRAIRAQQAEALDILAEHKAEQTQQLHRHTELLGAHTELLSEINDSQQEIKAAVQRLQPTIHAPRAN